MAGDLLAKDRAVDWPVLVDAGWVGLEVPEEFGGAGATFAEVAVDLRRDGPRRQRQQLPGQRRAGGRRPECVAAQRYSRPSFSADVASGRRSGWPSRSNHLDFVPDAEGADRVLLVHRCRRRPGRRRRAGLTVTPQPVLDETRRLATVSADGARGHARHCDSMAIPPPRSARLLRPRRGRGRLRQPRPFARRCFPRRWPTRRCATSSTAPSGRSRRSSTRAPTCW